MSLQLLLGGSGSGKTSYLYKNIINASMEHPEKQYFIIVPEQFTMQTQKDIVTLHPNHGTMNIDIVSFERLAYRVFEELAVEHHKVLDDMGKSMVLRKVAADCRRKLVLFSGHLNQTGFINHLKSMLSEFYQYGVTPQMLSEMIPHAGTPLLQQKLKDFAVVFEGFQTYISGHYITTEEVLDVLCQVVPQSGLIGSSVIALDGYTGFTPVQYRLISLLLKHSSQVIVTATAGEKVPVYESLGIQNLFRMSSQMVRHLTAIAKAEAVEKLEDIWMKHHPSYRFTECPPLDYLEQHLFRYGKGFYEGKPGNHIQLFQGANPSGEVAWVIHGIHRMVQEEGLRYRDIAVVTGDLAGYGKEISHQFKQHQIPCFMDDKKTILDNPMVELIRAALEVVQKNFSYETVFRYLRTGLITGKQDSIDRMENYVLALGIRGHKRFLSEWDRVYRGAGNLNLQELNEFREEIIAPLLAFREALGGEAVTIRDMADAILQLLLTCKIEEKMEAYQSYFLEMEDYNLAKEYGQVYGLVTELLLRIQELLGDEKVSKKEFMEILDAGFEEISVGVIPATVDRVVVGDIKRTRLAHIKVLFFVGVNDGVVPARKDSGSLLTDREREFFEQHQIELAPTAREDGFQQRFYLYLMMTKPSRRLFVSWSSVGADGKSRRASYLIGELQKLFPTLVIQAGDAMEDKRIYSVPEAKSMLIDGLRHFGEQENPKEETMFLELYRWFFHTEEYRDEVAQLVDAANYVYENHGISQAVAKALYGTILSGSVTRLEQYAACAYGHFLKFGLELMERQRYELAASDVGNLFHNSIDLCFEKMQREGRDWHTISAEERTELVHRCVSEITDNYGNTILSSSSRNAFLAKRVEHITQRTVWALQQQICKGDFTPAGVEVSFSASDNLRAMRIALSEEEELHLRGRIDRMDLCHDEEHVYVKIIDYKSGSTSFDLAALYYGLQLQLVVYMDAVMEMTERNFPEKEIVPAGIFYYNIQDPLIQKEGEQTPEEIEAEILRKLRMNGLVNSELEVIRHMDHSIETESDVIPVVLKGGNLQEAKSSVANRERFSQLRTYVNDRLKQTGQEILAGQIGAEPYKSGIKTACDYCPYHSVCGFDKKTGGFDYRRLKNKKAEEIWEEICQ